MSIQIIKVPVTLKMQEGVANIIARAELEGVYSQDGADFKLKKLEDSGITEESLSEYYIQLQYLVCAFAEAKRSLVSRTLSSTGFRFSELRSLYLPTIAATLLSQVGDVTIGNYAIEVYAPETGKIDRKFIIQMSEALYANSHILYSQRDQIGVANVIYNPDFMANIVTSMAEDIRQAEVKSKDGVNPDPRWKAFAALTGLSLVNQAFSILYPVVDYVQYGRPSDYLAINTEANANVPVEKRE